MKNRYLLIALVAIAVSSLAGAGEREQGNMFWGGWFGAGFDTVDFIELSPTVGKDRDFLSQLQEFLSLLQNTYCLITLNLPLPACIISE